MPDSGYHLKTTLRKAGPKLFQTDTGEAMFQQRN